MKIGKLKETDRKVLSDKLEAYNKRHLPGSLEGEIQIGIYDEAGSLIGGLDAGMTVDKMLYLSTIFVKEKYRGHGVGRRLMYEMEKQAAEIGADLIRLDSFSWEGVGFYEKLGYEVIGHYTIREGFEEYFYMKRI
ncbi:GNAT family N-acetyltransferase [Salinicoccus halodurans]|uniref:Acetyltransferase (GNAT) domain-containing protein n=1 Tax=Salinicoccus halodurans TaxID=407035 RepID=A0A0F7HJK7_9STAP|nr:GNAT family N-acetyltransferase [Salinicoccus halodurans]AKG73572.1 hypothetical protein AAT16_04695 [Salinicoccus halodurans]SFK52773.1 Acetyltransferase (GNAT) domain-containing protein [Salinicoccus halodurans]